MSKAFFSALLAALATAFCAWVIWQPMEFSSQEGVANLAKARDVWAAIFHPGGPSWWSPNFLGGASLATSSGTIFTTLWMLAWTALFGTAAGIKLSILACLPLGAASMFLLARRLVGRESVAAVAAAAYIMVSSFWMRALAVEHVVVVLAMAIFPLVCWSLIRLAQNPSLLTALLCAVICSALSLIYSKAALMAVPGLAALCVWALWKYRGLASWMLPAVWLPLFGGLVVLAVIPNLPSLREAGSAALFEFGPLSGWQQSFSTKSALHFFDRLGQVSADFRGDFAATTAAGAYYLGIVPILCLGLVLALRRRIFPVSSPELVSAFRVSTSLALFCYWLSHGPFSVFSGTLRALEASVSAADFFPAILWILVAFQGWLVWALIPESMPLRKPFAILLITIFLFVPGFERISWLPLYSDLRAPFDFYQVGGVTWTCLAIGVSVCLLLARISKPVFRWSLCAILGLVWVADFSEHLWLPKKSSIESQVMADFSQAADFLKSEPQPGSLVAVSGRYFYLKLPELTGRALLQEAFQSYLQPRGLAAWLAAGSQSLEDFVQSTRIAGGAFLLVDKSDPDLPKDFTAQIQEKLKLVYSNTHFDVFKIDSSFSPAYLAKDAVLLGSEDHQDATAALEASNKGFVSIAPVLPGKSAGTISEGALKLAADFTSKIGRPFEVLKPEDVERPGRGVIRVKSPAGPGWVVIPEAWHPDWTVSKDGTKSKVYSAFGALLAAEVGNQPSTFDFRFTPPWWYGASLWIGGISWLLALGFCTSLLLPRFRRFFSTVGTRPISALEIRRESIRNPLAISPTYNEAASLPTLLKTLFAADSSLHVLIIDDASPDGTAKVVRDHPEFSKRLHLLERGGKLGLGSAYREGFRWAAEHGYDACVEIDADLSHDPADVPRLLKQLNDETADAIIGSRYLDGLRVVNWPEHRLLISAFATQFVRFVLGMPLTDATSGFKALRVAALQKMDWSLIRAEGYGFQVELHHALWRSGARLKEIPIVFTERREGHTKMNVGIALEAAMRVLALAVPKKPSNCNQPNSSFS